MLMQLCVYNKKKCNMFQSFDLFIALSPIIVKVDVDMVKFLDAFNVENLRYEIGIVLIYWRYNWNCSYVWSTCSC